MSVNTLTEEDLQQRADQYEKAVMRSSKDTRKGRNAKKSAEQDKMDDAGNSNKLQSKDGDEDEDEDEQDAFDTFNPFGGSYK